MLCIQRLLSSSLSKRGNEDSERLSDVPKSQGRKELAHILDPVSTACCSPHIPQECGQRSFSEQDESRQDGGSCCRRGEEKQCFPDHVPMAAPGLRLGVNEQRPLQFRSGVSVGLFFTALPLRPGGRTTGQGVQSAEHTSSLQWGSACRTLL